MEVDFKKKKKVIQEDLAKDEECKEFEDDAQTYYKSLRARLEKEQIKKIAEKKKISKEEQKKRKERKAYYEEIKKIYREKKKK